MSILVLFLKRFSHKLNPWMCSVINVANIGTLFEWLALIHDSGGIVIKWWLK